MLDDKLMIVFVSPIDDAREDEFRDWYDSEHVPDVLKVPGVVSARRYELTEGQDQPQRHLVVYGLEGDPAAVVQEIFARLNTSDMPISDVVDVPNAVLTTWVAPGEQVRSPADS